MAGREFRIARVTPGTAADVLTRTVTAGQTFKHGAVLILASNLLSEAGSTPTTGIVGIALQAAFTNPGNSLPYTSLLASGSPIGGRPNDISVAINDKVTIFSGRLVNGATDPVTPAVTDIGVSYGVAKDANGIWYVDQANTTQLCVKVIDIEPLGGTNVVPLVYFKFINVSPLSN